MNTFIIAENIWFSHFFLFPYTAIYIGIGRAPPHIPRSALFEKEEKALIFRIYLFLTLPILYTIIMPETQKWGTPPKGCWPCFCVFLFHFLGGKNAS